MSDWAPNDLIWAKAQVVRQHNRDNVEVLIGMSQHVTVHPTNVTPRRTADEIAALEADAEKWRELVRGAEAFRRSPFPPPGPLYSVRHVEELEEMEAVIEAAESLRAYTYQHNIAPREWDQTVMQLIDSLQRLDAVRLKLAKERP